MVVGRVMSRLERFRGLGSVARGEYGAKWGVGIVRSYSTEVLSKEEAEAELVKAARGFRKERKFTPTGGDGKAATKLSTSREIALKHVRSLYRRALAEIPEMKKNFVLTEPESLIRDTIKSLIMANKDVKQSKVIDLLAFKGGQELEEISRQWKGRHHIIEQIAKYEAQLAREKNAKLVEEMIKQEEVPGYLPSKDSGDSLANQMKLREWKQRKLIPPAIDTWPQYLVWRKEEDERFTQFAIEHGLFSREDLEQNYQFAAARGIGSSF
mmetsp:Transcript_7536/g.13638  ORF Transcript_7536/g.13638 Transcript_7536/m.13638 type:complete len:268 (-) Transcript_7536:52-855(-)